MRRGDRSSEWAWAWACSSSAVLLLAGHAWAQAGPEPAERRTAGGEEAAGDRERETGDQEEEGGAGLRGLDELLGLEEAEPRDGDEEAAGEDAGELADSDRVELERRLSSGEAAEELESAVQQMRETAFRLDRVRDAGLTTQRLQEEVIKKLDVLVRAAEQQQSQSGGGGGSGSQSGQRQPAGGEMAQGQRSAAGQGRQQASSGGSGDETRAGDGRATDGVTDAVAGDGAAWGALPERVRDRLIEGSSDYFSAMYKSWTEAYYRRLAEEAGR